MPRYSDAKRIDAKAGRPGLTDRKCLMGLAALFLVAGCSVERVPAESGRDLPREPYQEAQEVHELRNREAATALLEELEDTMPSAAEVIARHLEAVGGRSGFDTIQTMVLRFTANGTSGSFGELIRYYRKPLHYRQEVVGSSQATVVDGNQVWQVGPNGWTEAPGEEGYLAFASMDNHLVDPDQRGIRHELVGVIALDADPGYLVRRTWPHGGHEDLFFSAVSGLLTGRKTSYPLMEESWFSYWDYRDFGGIRFPVVHIRSIGNLGPPHGLVLQDVQINLPLPDSLFLPPEGVG